MLATASCVRPSSCRGKTGSVGCRSWWAQILLQFTGPRGLGITAFDGVQTVATVADGLQTLVDPLTLRRPVAAGATAGYPEGALLLVQGANARARTDQAAAMQAAPDARPSLVFVPAVPRPGAAPHVHVGGLAGGRPSLGVGGLATDLGAPETMLQNLRGRDAVLVQGPAPAEGGDAFYYLVTLCYNALPPEWNLLVRMLRGVQVTTLRTRPGGGAPELYAQGYHDLARVAPVVNDVLEAPPFFVGGNAMPGGFALLVQPVQRREAEPGAILFFRARVDPQTRLADAAVPFDLREPQEILMQFTDLRRDDRTYVPARFRAAVTPFRGACRPVLLVLYVWYDPAATAVPALGEVRARVFRLGDDGTWAQATDTFHTVLPDYDLELEVPRLEIIQQEYDADTGYATLEAQRRGAQIVEVRGELGTLWRFFVLPRVRAVGFLALGRRELGGAGSGGKCI